MIILLLMGMCVLLIGMVIDLGYLYLVHTELHSIAESRALAAALELDGTWDGIYRARNTANGGLNPEGSNGADAPAGGLSVTTAAVFAKDPTSDYTTSPLTPEAYRFAKVSVTAKTRLFFTPLIPTVAEIWDVTATARAGLVRLQGAGTGMIALSPRARASDSENFGFNRGQLHALNSASSKACPSDTPNSSTVRVDYLNVGQRPDDSGLRDSIINGSNYLAELFQVNSFVSPTGLKGNLQAALRTRLLQDSDTVSTEYSEYVKTGNGRRMLVLPINDGGHQPRVTGFGVFFLQPDSCSEENAPCCAAYMGSAPVLNGIAPAGNSPGIYEISLLR